jgi:hypothetical protein
MDDHAEPLSEQQARHRVAGAELEAPTGDLRALGTAAALAMPAATAAADGRASRLLHSRVASPIVRPERAAETIRAR